MRKFQIGLAAAVLSAGTVVAVQAQDGPPPLPGQMDASRVTAGSYSVDPGHTLVGWKVGHFGFNDYLGLFGDVTGSLELDPANIEASALSISVPVKGVTTANAGLTGHLLAPGKDGGAPDFFGPEPEDATFVSTSVRQTSEHEAMITGTLTLNGVSRPVSLMARFIGAGKNPMSQKETVGFHGWGVIKRSDFNVNYGIPFVDDEVRLDITAAFEK